MLKCNFISVLISMLITPKVVGQEHSIQNIIKKSNWPEEYNPAKSKFFVHNELEIASSPVIVWNILIDALKWESWYEGAKNVSFTNQTDTILMGHTVFNWETMGFKFQTVESQYIPNTLLAWESKK